MRKVQSTETRLIFNKYFHRYGVYAPTNDYSKAFTVVYALVGVGMVLKLLKDIGEFMLHWQQMTMAKASIALKTARNGVVRKASKAAPKKGSKCSATEVLTFLPWAIYTACKVAFEAVVSAVSIMLKSLGVHQIHLFAVWG